MVPTKIRRSPRYPFVDLGTAVGHVRALWKAIGAREVGTSAAWKVWGYGPNSSGGIQTEAALKQFGLLDVIGRGRQRSVKISRLGSRISGGGDPNLRSWIKEAAPNPKIHQDLWDRWKANLPVVEAHSYLVRHRQFQDRGAKALVAEYQRTMSFLDTVPPDSVSDEVDRGLPKGAGERTSNFRSTATDETPSLLRTSSTSVSRGSGSFCRPALPRKESQI